MAKDFNKFMSQLQETNQPLDFFCDFTKIEENVEDVKLSLCMLNSLIGAVDLHKAVETIWKRDKSAFQVLDILIAVRRERTKKGNKKRKAVVTSLGNIVNIDDYYTSVDSVVSFLNETGLSDLLVNSKIKDLVDYVFGIETGLDSNARKNRSGHIMENKVREILEEHDVYCRSEVYSSEWPEITQALGTDKKRFDFVIKTTAKTYLLEVNFYSDGGSKLNEVARAYSELAPKINKVPGFEFVWITDGIGWSKAKNKIEEAYSIVPKVYNLTDIEDFIDIVKQEGVI